MTPEQTDWGLHAWGWATGHCKLPVPLSTTADAVQCYLALAGSSLHTYMRTPSLSLSLSTHTWTLLDSALQTEQQRNKLCIPDKAIGAVTAEPCVDKCSPAVTLHNSDVTLLNWTVLCHRPLVKYESSNEVRAQMAVICMRLIESFMTNFHPLLGYHVKPKYEGATQKYKTSLTFLNGAALPLHILDHPSMVTITCVLASDP